MSDLEDEDVILDDIKALEAVLTNKPPPILIKTVKSEDPSSTKVNLCEPSTSHNVEDLTTVDPFPERSDNEYNDEIDDDESESELEDLSEPKAALNLNRKLISLLTTTQKRLQFLLKECRRRQVAIDRNISQKTREPHCRTLLTIAGIPYFKDKKQFPAPKNVDAKLKAQRGELQVIDVPYPLRWTVKDRNTLWKAIYSSITDIRGHGEAEDPLRLDHQNDSRKPSEETIQFMKESVGPVGAREFDWLRIAATDFDGRHSASECKAMWNVFLHPHINRGSWKKNEDSKLKLLAKEYNCQNWDVIASELGTNRSGYQCFIRFNTNIKDNMINKSRAWTKEEDRKLTDIVNALRTGNFIPWGEVAKLMGNRRKQQVYMRWNYSLAPNLKKGRFTEEENKLLLQGVAKFGFNFTKISVTLMPHRNNAQLNDHYKTLMNEKKNEWNCEDDIKLVKLHDKLGTNWAAIAKEFSNKSRVQVRHRYAAIVRYLRRGLTIQTIPRQGNRPEETDTPEECSTCGTKILEEMSTMFKDQLPASETLKTEKISKIDLELTDYFKGIYKSASKRGRNKKFYDNEELDEKTQRLDLILNMLNADLDIPDDFDDELNLTEKDKQLLTSLKSYPQNETCRLDRRQKNIEYTRKRMFGFSTPLSEPDRFIPPLPFDGRVRQKSKMSKDVGINYQPHGNNYLVDLTYQLTTPETIVILNGGWENEIQFKKIEKIFLGQSKLHGHNSHTFDPNSPSTSALVSNKSRSAMDPNASFSELSSKKPAKYHPQLVIPPNYATLLGFRGILLSKHILEAKDSEEDDYPQEKCTITPEGREALELFEERLIKLFKFPIELSEIAPPFLHGLQNEHDDGLDNVNPGNKRKARSGPVAKRKLKTEIVIATKSSEAQ